MRPIHRPTMPRAVALGRQLACRSCPTPCADYQAGHIAHGAPAAACPLPAPRWRSWADLKAARRARSLGLGDVVAAVAQPIAKVIDQVAGTSLASCGGCSGRRADWNAAVPDVRHPFRKRPKGAAKPPGGAS